MKPRPSVRSLAAELGVSPISVSRALRDHPGVGPALRAKIQRAAKARGYKPDPVLAHVLGKLRKREKRYLETVAFVWTHEFSIADNEYAGACECAAQLGYQIEPVRPWEQALSESDVNRILWARGIRGVLLAPNHSTLHPHYDLDWSKFACVLIGSSLMNAGLTRARRDYFADAEFATKKLIARGCKRLGLVLDESTHERTNRLYAAAFVLHSGYRASLASRLIHMVDPVASRGDRRRSFRRWLRQEKPDAILWDYGDCEAWLREKGRLTPVCGACLSLHSHAKSPGIRPDFKRVGAEAMRALDGLLRMNQLGLRPDPITLLVPGIWTDDAPVV